MQPSYSGDSGRDCAQEPEAAHYAWMVEVVVKACQHGASAVECSDVEDGVFDDGRFGCRAKVNSNSRVRDHEWRHGQISTSRLTRQSVTCNSPIAASLSG